MHMQKTPALTGFIITLQHIIRVIDLATLCLEWIVMTYLCKSVMTSAKDIVIYAPHAETGKLGQVSLGSIIHLAQASAKEALCCMHSASFATDSGE